MRISDWSSDVCSSDLQLPRADRIYLVPVGDLLRLYDLRRDRLAMDDRGSSADHRWLRRPRPPQTPGLGRCRTDGAMTLTIPLATPDDVPTTLHPVRAQIRRAHVGAADHTPHLVS